MDKIENCALTSFCLNKHLLTLLCINGYITWQQVVIGLRKEAGRLTLANPAHPFPRAHSVIDALFKSGLWREGWGLRNMDLKAILCAVKQKLHYQVTYFQQKRTQSWDEFSPFLRTLHLFLTFFYFSFHPFFSSNFHCIIFWYNQL